MSSSVRPQKSTNVRLHQLRATGLRLLSPHAPALAARWAEYLFTRASRHPRPEWERSILEAAERTQIGSTPVWTWRGDRDVPAVILVHGWEGRGSQLGAFVEPLLAAGHRVVAFDAPGHGESTIRHASAVDHAKALAKVARAVGPVHAVIGHSIGRRGHAARHSLRPLGGRATCSSRRRVAPRNGRPASRARSGSTRRCAQR